MCSSVCKLSICKLFSSLFQYLFSLPLWCYLYITVFLSHCIVSFLMWEKMGWHEGHLETTRPNSAKLGLCGCLPKPGSPPYAGPFVSEATNDFNGGKQHEPQMFEEHLKSVHPRLVKRVESKNFTSTPEKLMNCHAVLSTPLACRCNALVPRHYPAYKPYRGIPASTSAITLSIMPAVKCLILPTTQVSINMDCCM